LRSGETGWTREEYRHKKTKDGARAWYYENLQLQTTHQWSLNEKWIWNWTKVGFYLTKNKEVVSNT